MIDYGKPDYVDTADEFKRMVDTANQIVHTAITFLTGEQEWYESDPAQARMRMFTMYRELIKQLAQESGLELQVVDATGLHENVDYLFVFTRIGLSGEATVPFKLGVRNGD